MGMCTNNYGLPLSTINLLNPGLHVEQQRFASAAFVSCLVPKCVNLSTFGLVAQACASAAGIYKWYLYTQILWTVCCVA